MSAIPGILDALVAATRNRLPDVQVLDGVVGEEPAQDVVAIGWSPSERNSVEADHTVAGLAKDRETLRISCATSSWTGDSDVKPRRDRAFELLNEIRNMLKDDVTIGGACARARTSFVGYLAELTNRGAVATVEFDITVDVWIR